LAAQVIERAVARGAVEVSAVHRERDRAVAAVPEVREELEDQVFGHLRAADVAEDVLAESRVVGADHGLEGGFVTGERASDELPVGRVAIDGGGEVCALAGLAMG
jgi:hypothetical protein